MSELNRVALEGFQLAGEMSASRWRGNRAFVENVVTVAMVGGLDPEGFGKLLADGPDSVVRKITCFCRGLEKDIPLTRRVGRALGGLMGLEEQG